MLCVPTLVLRPSSFDRRSARKSSLFPFPFPFFFSFFFFFFGFFLSSLYEFFLFFLCSLFFLFWLFSFSTFLLISFSHLFFFSFFSSHFLFSLAFSPPFGAYLTEWSREETSSPFLHAICVALNFPSFLFYFFYSFIASSHIWLIVSQPHIQVHHMALAMCHPTPYALKNVQFRLSRNSMKFNKVARFRETIPTMKTVSSSEI